MSTQTIVVWPPGQAPTCLFKTLHCDRCSSVEAAPARDLAKRTWLLKSICVYTEAVLGIVLANSVWMVRDYLVGGSFCQESQLMPGVREGQKRATWL